MWCNEAADDIGSTPPDDNASATAGEAGSGWWWATAGSTATSALGKQAMLEWLGSHYAETVGTLALIVTTTNLTISIYRLRREARAGSTGASSEIRSGHRQGDAEVSAPPGEPGQAATHPIGASPRAG